MASDARANKHVFVAGNATILHADLDPCCASVEQRDDPLERSRGVQPRRRPHARPTCMPLARMLLGAALPVAIAGGYDQIKRDARALLERIE
jgi:hypothetical protein